MEQIFEASSCLYIFQELAEPSIGDAFQSCVQQGANRVIVSPFFLSPGRHWSQVGLHRTLSCLSVNCQYDSLSSIIEPVSISF